MSLKHHKRTRAQILAKRQIDPQTWIDPVRKLIAGVPGPIVLPKPRSRSKYTPHIGAKEQERAKRLIESQFLNDSFVSHCMLAGLILSEELCHERVSPVLCRISRRDYVGEPY